MHDMAVCFGVFFALFNMIVKILDLVSDSSEDFQSYPLF